MPSHRYWRLVSIDPAAGIGPLEITCAHLLDDVTRMDAGTQVVASVPPLAGMVESLQDASPTTHVLWGSSKGLALSWDFGAPTKINNFRLGAASSRNSFPLVAALQRSDDGAVWTTYVAVQSIAWPGVMALTQSETRFRWSAEPYFTARGPANATLISGLNAEIMATAGYNRCIMDAFRSSGVLQIEFVQSASTGSPYAFFGVLPPNSIVEASSVGVRAYDADGYKLVSTTPAVYGAAHALSSVIGMVVDFGAGTITFYKDGVSQGVAFTDIAGLTLAPAAGARIFYTAKASIRPTPFLYPVAGAEPWFEGALIKQSRIATARSFDAVVHAAPPSQFSVTPLPLDKARRDGLTTFAESTANGRVAGTVKEKGTPNAPVHRKVRLIRERDGYLIREMWSHHTTGAYSFDWVEALEIYTVLSYDHTGAYNGVVATGLTPELMT